MMDAAPAIHIRSMRVRVPGTSADAGRALAQALRDQLGNLPAAQAVHLGAMNLRLPASSAGEAAGLPETIATAITQRLTHSSSSPHA